MSEHSINVIDREGDTHVVPWTPDESLMETLRDNDFPILASCGGTTSCATCHVYLGPEEFAKSGERSEDEMELLVEAEGYEESCSRLSCQVKFQESFVGATVTLAPEDE